MTVLVSSKQVKFYVHEAILTASSAFFKNALKAEWDIAGTKQIVIHDHHASTFRIYVNWLYTGHFSIKDRPAGKKELATKHPANVLNEQTKWNHCYALADFLQDADCKDALIDVEIERMITENVHNSDLSCTIYPLTEAESPHRKLPVDIIVMFENRTNYEALSEDVHQFEFLKEIIISMASKLGTGFVKGTSKSGFFKDVDTCKYHEHTLTNTPCYKTKRGI